MLIEILLETDRSSAEALSDGLMEAGALSASIEDADAGSTLEQPLFGEPGGEPAEAAWNRSRIVALMDAEDTDTPTQLAARTVELVTMASHSAGLEAALPFSTRPVADADWVRLTQAQFDPIHIGRRLWIVPSWHTPPEQPDALAIRLDPGLAFGTGSHATTRLCLAWLEAHLQAGQSVVDYGCGSGILAIAACKLGAGRVTGTDIDEQAIAASIANARDNQCIADFVTATRFHGDAADIVVANILSNPLKLLAPLLCGLVVPGGALVLSGILERQWQEVAQIYRPLIALDVWRSEDGWVCLTGRRAAEASA